MRFVSILIVLAGCDRLFNLQPLAERTDAGMSVTGGDDSGKEHVDARPGCTLDTFSTGMVGFQQLWNREESPPGTVVVVEADKLAIKVAPTSTVFGYAFTNRPYDLTGATVSVRVDKVIGAGNAETFFELERDAQSYYELAYSNGNLKMQLYREDSSYDGKTIAYDPVQHAYWRFQHSPSRYVVAFLTSPDGATWTERHAIYTSVPVVSLFPEVGAGMYSGTIQDGVSLFDDFELCL